LPLDGVVVVATPQYLAKLDAKRSINMIKKLNVRVLGVVENFTGEMFGQGAGEELAREMGLPFLGSLAMRSDYRDNSKPTVLVSPAVRAEYEAVLIGMKASLQASATAKG
ncbi:MAG: P-loop NTPase, partial [Chloroflexota bacterium]|nr:P-loop NTPase [Chloroflexota bacterium]